MSDAKWLTALEQENNTPKKIVSIMDWFTRKVLAWHVSNMREVNFCVVRINRRLIMQTIQEGRIKSTRPP